MTSTEKLYIDLLKKNLTDLLNEGSNHYAPFSPRSKNPFKRMVLNFMINTFEKKKIKVVQDVPFNLEQRSVGIGWPANGYTMTGMERLNNVEFCINEVLKNNVPGDFIETGVWKGGTCIFMRAMLSVNHITDRSVWVADSFQGLPEPDVEKYPEDAGDDLYSIEQLRVSLEDVKTNFKKFGMLDDQVKFLKGWFKDTLPTAPIEKLAVIRLDGDMYESTMDGLVNLYHKLSPGGFIIIDDYGAIEACKKAVHNFRDMHGITEEIKKIDWTGYYWQKN